MLIENIKPKNFIVIRHAETFANTKGVTCGATDSLVTEAGIRQAKALGKKLRKKFCDSYRLYHSSLTRARQTAKIIQEYIEVDDVVQDPLLNEHSFGSWEEEPWEEVFARLNKGKIPPGGESRDTFRRRVVEKISQILDDVEEGVTPIIVGHGGTFYALSSFFGFYPPDIENCGMIKFVPNVNKGPAPWQTYKFDLTLENWVPYDIFLEAENAG